LDIGRSLHGLRYKAHVIDTRSVNLGLMGPPPVKVLPRAANGKRLPFAARLRIRATELFRSIPKQYRFGMKIPQWYANTVGVPKYYFRTPGSRLSQKQVCISTLCRLYFIYRFTLRRGDCNTATLIRGCKGDSVYRLFLRLKFSVRWYTISHMIYRRLKVLLHPN
jgi:hypothetical protein